MIPGAIARTNGEVDEQINLAMEAEDSGESNWPGMSYEQGVAAALRWVTGEAHEAPMEDD